MEVINKNELGDYILSINVFKDIAKAVALKVQGVYQAKKDDEFVECKIVDNEVSFHLYIKLKQGVDIVKTCNTIQKRIHDAILGNTNVECKTINIDIQGFVSNKSSNNK